MTDEELDTMLTERFKDYAASVRLPGGFKRRFVGSIKRARAVRRLRFLGIVGIAAVTLMSVLMLGAGKPAQDSAQKYLVAASPRTNETAKVSGWMLLGYLRECIRRSRPARRKEEE